MFDFRNPIYNKVGSIDCEINHPQFGWIWTTVAPYDVNAGMRELYSVVAAADIAPYVPPTDEEVRASLPDLSRKQFRLGLRDLEISTATIQSAIEAMADENQREIAQIEWEDSDLYSRMHPLISQLKVAFNLSDEQIDATWKIAATYI